MKILVLNCGSSSVKYRLFDKESEHCLAWGVADRIGARGSLLKHQRDDGDVVKLSGDLSDHSAAVEYILAILMSPNHGVIGDKKEIAGVGHRVVHGGEKFTDSALIDQAVMKQLHECIELAPLHNPHNINGIKAAQKLLPTVPQVAVFDTAFHQGMPDYAYLYGLPYVLYKKYGVRRYGFHGTSHRYVANRAATMLEQPLDKLKLISCHLGNGCSMAAVDCGVSIDTSMGLTPTEGLLMGTRVGDMDPAALLFVMDKEDISSKEANSLINKHSGLQGLSGVSNDMRELETEIERGNKQAEVAVNVFAYRVRKYIGAYAAAMGGLDGVIFTGGIGENSPLVREKSVDGLEFLGLKLNKRSNSGKASGERFIDKVGAKARLMVIPTNEELVIMRDTLRLME